jgi:hypothetical protein
MADANNSWITPDWPCPPSVRALVTTRIGGVSTGAFASLNLGDTVGDDADNVAENRQRLQTHLPSPPKWLRQVHGSIVVDAAKVTMPVAADGSVATAADTVCVVMAADCLPVLLCDRAASTVAAAHAGWRGLCSGVLENTVQAMRTAPGELMAYLGPAIGPDAFEVGDEVLAAFVKRDPQAASAFRKHRKSKWFADLFMLARQRLKTVGVTEVYGGTECTYSDPARFFSHRRDKVSGRMAALIWKTNA